MIGSAAVTGDSNTVSVQYQQAALPPPESVDMAAELRALREALATLQTTDRRKIDNALDEAEDELKKPQPDKNEVGKAVERALDYAKKADGFTEAIAKIQPRVEKAAAWLGENWYKLLGMVNLVV
jgi:hypothetical protein